MLKKLYNAYCETPSDINEHLPILKELAYGCKSVTEMWVRTALSSTALLMWCDNVISYDIETNDNVKELQSIVPNRDFRIWDTREIEISETDMLFIDTLHNGELLRIELERHAPKVRKFIAFHDTETFWERWETKQEWLLQAIDDYLLEHKEWKRLKVFNNNNGLTVLKRISDPVVTVFTAIFWDYDTLKMQPEQKINCRFVCFTDNPDLRIERWAENQREIIVVDKNPYFHPRMKAKWHRLHPYEYFDGTVMYIDGTARLKKRDSVEFFVNQLQDNDIICFKHPERNSITQEMEYICNYNGKRRKKYKWLPLREQVESYIANWFPDNIWLSATWLLIHKKSDRLIDFLDKWYQENVKWSYQDQLSFEPTIYFNNINRKHIDIEWDLRNNDYITFLEWHLRDD